MNKIFKVFLMVALIIAMSTSVWGKSVFVEANADFLFPADSNFKDIYKSTVFMPFFKGGLKFSKNIYAFAGYGFANVDGEFGNEDISFDTKAKLRTLRFGLGYEGDFSKKFHYRLELGGNILSYKENCEYQGDWAEFNHSREVDESKFALYFGTGLVCDFSESFYACFNLSYSQAKADISDDYDDVNDLKIGGLDTSIGLGIRF